MPYKTQPASIEILCDLCGIARTTFSAPSIAECARLAAEHGWKCNAATRHRTGKATCPDCSREPERHPIYGY